MYTALNNSTLTGTPTTDVNEVERYSINVASNFYSEKYAIGKEHNHVTVEFQLTGYSGTGTISIEHSRDGIVWYPLINSSGSNVSLSVASAVTGGCLIVDNYPLGYHRVKWVAGTGGDATSGTMQLLLEL